MSILSVDTIQPIGSGTSVTVNSAATLVLTNANSTGVITATSFVGSGANLTGLAGGGTGLDLNDNTKIRLGTGNDYEIYHDGSNAVHRVTGDGDLKLLVEEKNFIVQGTGGHQILKGIDNGAVEIYHNNSKKLETTSSGITLSDQLQVTGTVFATGGLKVNADNQTLRIGAGDDLQLSHDGSDSFIKDTGTGALKVCSNLFRVNNAANDEAMIKAEENAGVTLSYDANTKFETISTGINVTGGVRIGGNNAANELDDYEEGSFTPQFDGLSNTPVYAARNGRYTKIGRYVHITGIIQTGGTNPTFSNTSAILTLTGLPFAGTGVIYYVSLGNVSHQHWDCYGSGNNENNFASGDADFLNCQMVHNTSTMVFILGKGGNTRSRVRNASMHNSGAIIIFELSYTV